jgi:nucleotide-binding universal stress UspA family protein
MFRRIVVPVDGSELAERVFARLAKLLRAPRTDVVALTVLRPPTDERAAVEGTPVATRSVAHDYLLGLAERCREKGIGITTVLKQGVPDDAIVSYARKSAADLIVISSHGRTGNMRWLRGSVAEKVLRRTPVPLFILRAGVRAAAGKGRKAAPAANGSFRRIVVPLDGSAEAERALAPAAYLATLFGSRVHVLQAARSLPVSVPPPPVRKLLGLDAGSYLAKHAEALRRRKIPAESVLVEDDPASAILEFARQKGIGLIVMTTSGRSGVRRLILGSVAERVAHSSLGSLLVIPPERRDKNRLDPDTEVAST